MNEGLDKTALKEGIKKRARGLKILHKPYQM